MSIKHEDVRAALLGSAIGDAFGVPFEFLSAGEVAKYPLDRMYGIAVTPAVNSRWGARFPAGAWSDDTSMAAATMDSLIATDGHVDPDDLMRRFLDWWQEGEYCALEEPFGIGKQTRISLGLFASGRPASDCGGARFHDNGNGSLMRTFPITLVLAARDVSIEKRISTVCRASKPTHAHPISMFSCVFYSEFLLAILSGKNIRDAYKSTRSLPFRSLLSVNKSVDWPAAIDAHRRILDPGFEDLTAEELSATGYVVDSLEIALYSLLHSSSFTETLTTAVSFGFDTDTYAAIAGAPAGAHYGTNSIPSDWLTILQRRSFLEELATRFSHCFANNETAK